MDNNKKKNLKIYILFLISFLMFSIYGFSQLQGKADNPVKVHPKIEDKVVTKNTIKKEKTVDCKELKNIDRVGDEYEKVSIDIVNNFLKSYHLIETNTPLDAFKKAKDIVVEPLYLELEKEVVGNASVKNNGLVYRTIENTKIHSYTFNEDSKDINIKASVYSNWLNKDKEISLKNELTRYNFLITNDNGDWKISQFTTEVY